MAEDMSPDRVAQAAAQSGLFGRHAPWSDSDAAFTGQAGGEPHNEIVRVLGTLPDGTQVVVIDVGATSARQKAYRALGNHRHLPTPRFGKLAAWIRDELRRQDVAFHADVPPTLADLFGEDLPAIAAEIQKLAVLDEELTASRVIEIANRPAARNAFDLIDAVVAGDTEKALAACRHLTEQGEAPHRVMGAIAWQFDVVARGVALQQGSGRVAQSEAASRLRASPYVAKKALAIATQLDEASLYRALSTMLAADVAMKSGRDPEAAIEVCTIELAGMFADR
jgi:DNA polymerase-3 subunit delta